MIFEKRWKVKEVEAKFLNAMASQLCDCAKFCLFWDFYAQSINSCSFSIYNYKYCFFFFFYLCAILVFCCFFLCKIFKTKITSKRENQHLKCFSDNRDNTDVETVLKLVSALSKIDQTKMYKFFLYYAPRPAERSKAGRGAFLFLREFKFICTY